MFTHQTNKVFRFLWLTPVIIAALGCFYFINLFNRLDNDCFESHLLMRNSIIDAVGFIQKKDTLYNYIRLTDRVQNTTAYLMDENFKLVNELPHPKQCFTKDKIVVQPYKNKKYIARILQDEGEGSFYDKKQGIDFKYKTFKVENKKYTLLVGSTEYDKPSIYVELQFAIAALLLITALANAVLIAFIKQAYFACRNKKEK